MRFAGWIVVGVTGLEPATSSSRTTRATNCATPRHRRLCRRRRCVGRETGFEPATSSLARKCSTAELLPLGLLHAALAPRAGIEPATPAFSVLCSTN